MNRRKFISVSCLTGAITLCSDTLITFGSQEMGDGYVMTVGGKLPGDKMGVTLPHEHIITDFTGAEKIQQPQYQRSTAFKAMLPYLLSAKASGLNTFIDCTPAYIGRDVILLKQLSEATGLNIITNTGYYAAADQKYLPAHAYTESSEQLAARWMKEWEQGIEDNGIRPGFIKLGVGVGALKPVEQKLIRTAAKVHLKTGLKIAIHTGDGTAAVTYTELLINEGVRPDALIWVHAQNDSKGEFHTALAMKGCYISFDGFNKDELATYCRYIKNLKEEGLLNKVLLSHDDGFSVEKKDSDIIFNQYQNGNSIPYGSVFTILKPALLQQGVSALEFDMIVRDNPRHAFKIEVCRVG